MKRPKEFRLITKDGDVICQPGEWPPPRVWNAVRWIAGARPLPSLVVKRKPDRELISFDFIGIEVDLTGTWARYEESSRRPF